MSKTVSPKYYSYTEEDNSTDVGVRMMYPLHFTGVKFIDLKKTIGIKDATTKYIPGADIHDDPYI